MFSALFMFWWEDLISHDMDDEKVGCDIIISLVNFDSYAYYGSDFSWLLSSIFLNATPWFIYILVLFLGSFSFLGLRSRSHNIYYLGRTKECLRSYISNYNFLQCKYVNDLLRTGSWSAVELSATQEQARPRTSCVSLLENKSDRGTSFSCFQFAQRIYSKKPISKSTIYNSCICSFVRNFLFCTTDQ